MFVKTLDANGKSALVNLALINGVVIRKAKDKYVKLSGVIIGDHMEKNCLSITPDFNDTFENAQTLEMIVDMIATAIEDGKLICDITCHLPTKPKEGEKKNVD